MKAAHALVTLVVAGVFFAAGSARALSLTKQPIRDPFWRCRVAARCLPHAPRSAAQRVNRAEIFRGLGAQDVHAGRHVQALRRALSMRRALLSSTTPLGTAASATASGPSSGTYSIRWTALGPDNIGGRVNTLLTNPSNAQELLAGTAGGGIWLSTDGGASWTSVGDFLGSLAVSSLARAPDGTLFAGTGDQFNYPKRGIGILASSDGGSSWTALAATDPTNNRNWFYVNWIAINSNNVMLVSTGVPGQTPEWGGIYRSTNDGQSFTEVQTGASMDAVFDPNNPGDAVAEFENGTIRYSTDAGQTWSAPVTLASGGGRITLAFAHDTSHAGWVYASVNNNPVTGTTPTGPSGQIWLSKDDGKTWTKLASPDQLCNSDNSECQGNYDNVLWVDPTNALELVTGGINLFRSSDGGNTWTQISNWQNMPASPHADQHALVSAVGFSDTTNPQVYVGNDGGVYGTSDIFTATPTSGWAELNTGLADTQFYSVAGHVGDVASANGGIVPIIGGAQDNGTEIRAEGASNNHWAEFYGGDGGTTAVDPANANNLYGEYAYLDLFNSTDGGQSANTYSTEPNAHDATSANFIAPFLLDPVNVDAMYAGGLNLWYGTSIQTASPSWRSLDGSTLPQNAGDFINAIAVDPQNRNNVWVGFDGGGVYHSTQAFSSQPNWQQINVGPAAEVTAIHIVPGNPKTVYVCYWQWHSGNIYKTSDGGASWSELGQTLPPVPVNALLTDPRNAHILYAGTEVGLFVSEDGGQTWSTSNQGPANVAINRLRWFDLNTPKLLVATYGRGVFMGRPDNLVPKIGSLNPAAVGVKSPGFTLAVQGSQFATGATVDWNGNPLTTHFVSNTQLTADVPGSDLVNGGTVPITVFNPTPGGGTSAAVDFTISTAPPSITQISPSTATAGSSAIALTVSGSHFVSSSVVYWNGNPLTTTYDSASQLTAKIPVADLTTSGSFEVTVANGNATNATSGAVPFTVTSPGGKSGGGGLAIAVLLILFLLIAVRMARKTQKGPRP